MKSYFATYRSIAGIEPVESTVLIFDKNLSIGVRNVDATTSMVNWNLKDVECSFEFSRQKTKLRNHKFPGAELLIDGNDAANFVKERQSESQKPWYQKSSGREWIRNSVLLIFILGALFALYLLIVPWLSQKLAAKVSVKTEKQLGDAVYNALRLEEQEDTAKSKILNEFFSAMKVSTSYPIRISVIKNEVTNAFALPGGRIVVYSALLDEITSYPELAALLSHEFTHINNKHSTRSIFRSLGSKVFLGLLFGSFGAVTSVVVDHAENLRSLKYSRKLEKEADMEGLSILLKRQIDPSGFESLFNHLKKAAPVNNLPEFLTSHPDTDKRVGYINEASSGAVISENLQLKTIFEKIN